MRFPSIASVTWALKEAREEARKYVDPGEDMDVRLQVYSDGAWALRTGLSDYDQDHRGFWGAGSITASSMVKDLRQTAKDLLEQVQDAYASCGR
jgi:hypothetical protein